MDGSGLRIQRLTGPRAPDAQAAAYEFLQAPWSSGENVTVTSIRSETPPVWLAIICERHVPYRVAALQLVEVLYATTTALLSASTPGRPFRAICIKRDCPICRAVETPLALQVADREISTLPTRASAISPINVARSIAAVRIEEQDVLAVALGRLRRVEPDRVVEIVRPEAVPPRMLCSAIG